MASKNQSPTTPELAELSTQILLTESRARLAEAHAKYYEATLRRLQAVKAIESFKGDPTS
jgi:hypothetical protein